MESQHRVSSFRGAAVASQKRPGFHRLYVRQAPLMAGFFMRGIMNGI